MIISFFANIRVIMYGMIIIFAMIFSYFISKTVIRLSQNRDYPTFFAILTNTSSRIPPPEAAYCLIRY